MSERNPFGKRPAGASSGQNPGGAVRCEEWEAMLADALDGLLTPTEGVAFEAHSQECRLCAQLLAEAKQGQEWMQFLHVEPEMPSDMMEKILSRTSGVVAERPLAIHGAPIPAGPAAILHLPRRKMVWDTRLMMTAAMAFFSIALTLNLTGVRLTGLRLADLTPANMQNNLTRQFYGAKGSVVRYYDNLRFVYELESKLRELRRDEDSEKPASTPAGGGEQKQQSAPNKNGGKGEALPPVSIKPGQQVLALNNQERILIGSPTDQAERSLA
ncbi:anti-sigma factor family protein [Silvibacterium acidisoli]|uniref:anti-sigma factor family protein n=1 Tax=Acidobacteriaceae bacterium ZG23-2 TaxID=2883246 RepID=UPI00406C2628